MQKLLLIRHAKAAAFGREPGDHARPLSGKGHNAASVLGEILVRSDWVPDLAVVSNALRTRETWADMAMAFDKPAVRYEETLYLALPHILAQAATRHGCDGQTLALIGHNPGIAILAYQLIEEGFDHNRLAAQAITGNFKTGWAAAFEIRDEGPRLVHLFDPRTA